MQQPCSNLSKSPKTLRNAPMGKYGDLQAFCKIPKPLANYRAAFARRRSGVRIPSAPLRKLLQIAGKPAGSNSLRFAIDSLRTA